ncbi:alanine racemase [Methylovirgula sp. 4M-Z18]|uniref:alanine racemase n=1 Tax=Methylovirgula sp. 4M-Z18 TaxID=2293567 RepID=UPI000E2F29D2|nr:alanine racemase [Methylovirgula sp. 4M-Z18]RFB81446.1 alanine racemase [Methylovirgula sp. 4M-Z18]
MPDPIVTINLALIEHNARAVVTRCARGGIQVYGVTKGACGMPTVARAMLRGGVAGLAESRFENIRRLRASGIDCKIMLLRSPPMVRIEELIRIVDVSLQSELPVIREISRTAERIGRVHDIILMVDLGDLREGIWPNDLLPVVEDVMNLSGVRIVGVGVNLMCFGGIMPTVDNMNQLVAHAYKVEARTGLHLDFISGGGSSSLPLLVSGDMPPGINNLRVGEAILQGGAETFHDAPWPPLDQNVFQLTAELLEVKLKPSLPIGKTGFDAFGNVPRFVDEGDRLRGIANIGREDVMVDGLIPTHKGVRVLGASSDHLVLDLHEADPPLQVGDSVSFKMNYGAMLAVMTSEYVEKVPMREAPHNDEPPSVSIHTLGDADLVFALHRLSERLGTFGVVVQADDARTRLDAGPDRRIAWDALKRSAPHHDALGLLWIDPLAALMPDHSEDEWPAEHAVLRRIMDRLPPYLSPENIVLIGLRRADSAEAEVLKARGIKVYTMVEIDAVGLRQIMREALNIVTSGTSGYHVHYSPDVTDMPGWIKGLGGITVRETHQVMEAVFAKRGMVSLSLSQITSALPPQVAAECVNFLLSAFGKKIL